ncbi:hypothetical protein VB005_08019 [Metarhizium brunneum]
MSEPRPSRSAKSKAKAKLTRRTTRGNIRDENDDEEHEEVELDPRKMHVGMLKAFQRMADKYQSDVLDPASAIHKDQLTALNKRMKKSIHPAMPKVHVGRDGWSKQDENDVLDQWEAEKHHWIDINDVKLYHMLWKICLQYAKCTPWDIVGFNTKLSFELSCRGDLGGEVEENHTWSSDFSDHLAWLIPHPAWAGGESSSRPSLLATAIQYAVILRTNDQRVWRLNHLGDEFLVAFAALCRESCPCSIAGVHAEVLARRRAEGIKTIPIISRVFQSLEKVIQTPTDSFVPADEEPYFVTTQDLTNLIRALDQIVDPDTKLRMFLPVEFVYESAQSAHGGRQPPTREQLHEYHKLALIEEMRRKAKATRSAQSNLGPDDDRQGGGQGDDDDDDDDVDPFQSLTLPRRPMSTTSTTRRRRLSHVSATPSDERSRPAASSEAQGLDSEPGLTRTRPSSAGITQSLGLGSGRGLLWGSDDSGQSGGGASEPESRDDFGLDDGFDHGGEPEMGGESGHDGEDAPEPDLGGESGHDGEEAPETLDDDAMSVDGTESECALGGSAREQPMAPRGYRFVRWGYSVQTRTSGMGLFR